MKRSRVFAVLAVLTVFLSACGINSIPRAEEEAKARWADVQAAYQRRANLIPNLVATVRGAAASEERILTGVTQARADATRIQLSPADLEDPAKVQEFSNAQARLSAAIIPLQRLQEAYPDLKSNQNFLALQDQLEGTENRINTSRQDYNEAVRQYNTTIRTFPDAIGAKIFYGAKAKVPFQAAAGSDKAPGVDFSTSG